MVSSIPPPYDRILQPAGGCLVISEKLPEPPPALVHIVYTVLMRWRTEQFWQWKDEAKELC